MPRSLDITIDLTEAEKLARQTQERLARLHEDLDLARFEYTTKVRIAPLEIPHSHPVLTINARATSDLSLLSLYLHEQMHWYVTRFARHQPQDWQEIKNELRTRYPKLPVGMPEGARTEESSYLHLVVNFLEIEATSNFFERSEVENWVAGLHFYRAIYAAVLADWDTLMALYETRGLLPIRSAAELGDAEPENANEARP